MESLPTRIVLLWVNDLIFETKIRSTAQALGVALFSVRNIAALSAELDRARPSLVIVDLNASGADPIEAVATAKTHAAKPRVVAYVSHVDADLAARAQAAGVDEVMPRSRFSTQLPQVLAGLT